MYALAKAKARPRAASDVEPEYNEYPLLNLDCDNEFHLSVDIK